MADPLTARIRRDYARFESLAKRQDEDASGALAVARLVVEKIIRAVAASVGLPTTGQTTDTLAGLLKRSGVLDARAFRHYSILMELDDCDGEDDGGDADACRHEEIEICKAALHVLTAWFERRVAPKVGTDISSSLVPCLSIQDIERTGGSARELLAEIIALDRRIYGKLPDDHEGDIDHWIRKWKSFPDSGRVILNQAREVVGYWSAAFLYEEDFELMKAGELNDGELTPDRLCDIELPGVYKLYVISVCIDDRYRTPTMLRSLLWSLADVLEGLARQGVYFDEICANAYTDKGESLCRSVGLRYLGPQKSHGKMYWDRLIPLNCVEFFQTRKDLVNLYNARVDNAVHNVLNSASGLSKGSPWRYNELSAKIEDVELSLRSLIVERLESDLSLVPADARARAEELLIKALEKNPALDRSRYKTLGGLLEFFDLRELEAVIKRKNLWCRFEPVFHSKDLTQRRFDQLAEVRNIIRHSRHLDKISEQEGEAAILWFSHHMSSSVGGQA